MLSRRPQKAAQQHQKTGYANPASLVIDDLVAYKRFEKLLPLQSETIRSLQSGSFLSPFRGRGMEFTEARPYQAGDDIRHLDWRLTARIGKPHSKVFQEERERMIFLWVDLHPAMFFATQGAFKSVVAAHAAALIAWNAAQQGNRVGGIITSPDHHTEVRPLLGKRGVLHFFQQLVQHPAWHRPPNVSSSIPGDTFLRLRRVVKSGSLIFLFSDMRNITSDDELQLSQMARHNDIILCHIHDTLETTLPPAGRYKVTDGDRTTTIDTGNAPFRRQYAASFALRSEYLRALCLKQGLHLISLATDADLVHTIRNGLGRH